MRMSAEAKDQSRARILQAAGQMFRDRGIDGASVNDIMRAAGMTHGGFYRHFQGKDDLLAAALAEAFARFAPQAGSDPQAFRARYLSADHVANAGQGCPAAALGAEVARAAPEVRAAFGAGLETVITGLAPDNRPESRAAALRDLSTMLGAVILARATGGQMADEILTAVQGAK
jgi:TetR/AcrR family transcriptional repressor of nem operon